MNYRVFKPIAIIILGLISAGCAYRSELPPPIQPEQLPENWWGQHSETLGEQQTRWLSLYGDEQVLAMVAQALQNNFSLLARSFQVEQAATAADVKNADRWPDLSASLDATRSQSQVGQQDVIGNQFRLGANVSWELDLWGRLSAADQAAFATFLASRADFEALTLSIVSQVVKAWYNIKESQQLLSLFEQRLDNLRVNQDVIELGFRQGINGALDVYLARSDVNREHARVTEQRQIVDDRTRSLQVLLGEYPDADVQTNQGFPELPASVPVGIPSDLLVRRHDINAAWQRLKSADADLAAAHRARFPSLSLTASAAKTSSEFSDLLDGSSQWSLGANILQSLFDQGRLRNLEKQARFELLALEQSYQETVFNAFQEVESYLSNEVSLAQQLAAYTLAQENAVAAEQQAFEQYRKGLTTYSTVLEAQRRAFDTQTSVIQLRNQMFQNRINLHVALGGSF
ncbi:MAG: efflux transporter outer membrane subunit [Pseudomonadales bacterium]|nr:efflux transporter outer membrane subunit [Pseudomonadales bacterium]